MNALEGANETGAADRTVRFYFGLPFYVGTCFLACLLAITIYDPDILEFLYLVVAVPSTAIFFWAYSSYNNGIERRSALLVLLICGVCSWLIVRNSFDVRSEARWLVGSKAYKREVLSQAPSPDGQLRHIEWDRWGWAGIGNTVIYLALIQVTCFRHLIRTCRVDIAAYPAKCAASIVWRSIGMQSSSIQMRVGETAREGIHRIVRLLAVCYSCCMQITVTIPDELAAQVQSRGLDVDTYLQGVVDETLRERERLRGEQHRAAVDAMLRFGEEHPLSLGGDDLKSMVHEGHKY